ncbi:hypothetical protein BSLG_008952 [Batrachochytrium salamandrivorans]|nr:hypothetical protein BSLG_008952 [Batrachochytrium salamandrivorans]
MFTPTNPSFLSSCRASHIDSGSDGEYGGHGAEHGGRRRNGAASGSKRSASNDSDDSDNPVTYDAEYNTAGEDDDADAGEVSDPEWSEVKSWSHTDLMGDANDRRSLMAMSELEREMVLADRQKKAGQQCLWTLMGRILDALRERTILKRRLNRQTGLKRGSSDLRGQRGQSERDRVDRSTFDTLRQKRESRERERREQAFEEDANGIDSDVDDGRRRTRAPSYSSHSEDETSALNTAPHPPEVVVMEDIQNILVTRDDLERWAHASFFTETVVGCFVRIGVGNDPNTREQVYRLARIVETPTYHRAYRLAGTLTKTSLKVAHGKAAKIFLMDIVSNKPFTVSEWHRYEQTMLVEKQSIISPDQARKKRMDIQKAREHVFTNDEINEMIKRKKALIKVPTNITLEKLRLKQAVQIAEEKGNAAEAAELKDRIFELNVLGEKKTRENTSHLEGFTKLNERNRQSNFTEGREAEKSVLELKKAKGTVAYDPFARRKTAPVHVVNGPDDTESPVPLAKESISVSKMYLLLVGKLLDPFQPIGLLSLDHKSERLLCHCTMILESIDTTGLEDELQAGL